MSYADYIAIVISIFSLLIAAVAAWRAQQANEIAKTSNQLTKGINLRPLRLDAQNHLRDFAHSCAMFSTRFQMKSARSTSDLYAERDALIKNLQALGPLEMPEIEDRAEEMMKKVVHLQRSLDRSRAADPKPFDSKFETVQDEIDHLVQWFDKQRREIPAVVEHYIRNDA